MNLWGEQLVAELPRVQTQHQRPSGLSSPISRHGVDTALKRVAKKAGCTPKKTLSSTGMHSGTLPPPRWQGRASRFVKSSPFSDTIPSLRPSVTSSQRQRRRRCPGRTRSSTTSRRARCVSRRHRRVRSLCVSHRRARPPSKLCHRNPWRAGAAGVGRALARSHGPRKRLVVEGDAAGTGPSHLAGRDGPKGGTAGGARPGRRRHAGRRDARRRVAAFADTGLRWPRAAEARSSDRRRAARAAGADRVHGVLNVRKASGESRLANLAGNEPVEKGDVRHRQEHRSPRDHRARASSQEGRGPHSRRRRATARKS